MKTRTLRRRADVVFHRGKPSAVILDIEDYESLLERLEDIEDLEYLRKMRKKPLHFRRLEDFLREHEASV